MKKDSQINEQLLKFPIVFFQYSFSISYWNIIKTKLSLSAQRLGYGLNDREVVTRFATAGNVFSVLLTFRIGSGVHADLYEYYNGQRWLFLQKVNRWILEADYSPTIMDAVITILNYNYTPPPLPYVFKTCTGTHFLLCNILQSCQDFEFPAMRFFSMERTWFMFIISTFSAVEYTGLCSLKYSKAQKHQEQSCAW